MLVGRREQTDTPELQGQELVRLQRNVEEARFADDCLAPALKPYAIRGESNEISSAAHETGSAHIRAQYSTLDGGF